MSSSDVFLTNDFENGSLGSWRLESPRSSAIQVSSAQSRGGNKSLQFTLNQSDPIVNNGKRAEIRQSPTKPGTEQWYGFSQFLPESFVSDRERELVAQWHSIPDADLGEGRPGAPPLALHTINGEWQLLRRWDSKRITQSHQPEGSQNINLGRYKTGEWTDWVFHIKWSYKSDGLIEVWKDGKLVVREEGPNTYNDQVGPNFKLGIYKPGWRDRAENSSVRQRTLFVDEVRIADKDATFADVDPATYAGRKPGSSSPTPSPTPTPTPTPQPEPARQNLPLDFVGKPVGTQLATTFDLAARPASNLQLKITANDIDAAAEAKLYLNGQALALPAGIIKNNGGSLTDTLSVDPSRLVAGKNTLTFEFASTLKGTTTGYRVEGLEVIVPKAAATAPVTPAAPQGQSFQNLPLRFFDQPVGTQRSTVFYLADLSQSARLTISANDIDATQEAKLYLNGKQIGLPQGIVEKNGGILTDSLTLDASLLKQGENTLTFELGTNPNGSSGYSITALAIA